jgi:hypothetical protein
MMHMPIDMDLRANAYASRAYFGGKRRRAEARAATTSMSMSAAQQNSKAEAPRPMGQCITPPRYPARVATGRE